MHSVSHALQRRLESITKDIRFASLRKPVKVQYHPHAFMVPLNAEWQFLLDQNFLRIPVTAAIESEALATSCENSYSEPNVVRLNGVQISFHFNLVAPEAEFLLFCYESKVQVDAHANTIPVFSKRGSTTTFQASVGSLSENRLMTLAEANVFSSYGPFSETEDCLPPHLMLPLAGFIDSALFMTKMGNDMFIHGLSENVKVVGSATLFKVTKDAVLSCQYFEQYIYLDRLIQFLGNCTVPIKDGLEVMFGVLIPGALVDVQSHDRCGCEVFGLKVRFY